MSDAKRAVVLWTGGKDSWLALRLSQDQGYRIVALATFVPSAGPEFKAHPQSQMRRQADQLGLEIHFLPVAEPFRDTYISGLAWIRDHLKASAVITGDIDLVEGFPNWIAECARGLGLDVQRPLWRWPRAAVLEQLLARGIRAQITWINHPALPSAWLRRTIDSEFLEEMKSHGRNSGFDLAGENGEYHTMVLGDALTERGRPR